MKLEQISAETDSELGMQSCFHFRSEHWNHIIHGLMHADTASVNSCVYLYYCTYKAWFPCFLLSLLLKVFFFFWFGVSDPFPCPLQLSHPGGGGIWWAWPFNLNWMLQVLWLCRLSRYGFLHLFPYAGGSVHDNDSVRHW